MSGSYTYEAVHHLRYVHGLGGAKPFVVLTPGKFVVNNMGWAFAEERLTILVNPDLHEELKAKYPMCERNTFVHIEDTYAVGAALFDPDDIDYVDGIPRLNAIIQKDDPSTMIHLVYENFRLIDAPPEDAFPCVVVNDQRFPPGKISLVHKIKGTVNFGPYKGKPIWIVYELSHQYHGQWHCFDKEQDATRYFSYLQCDFRTEPGEGCPLSVAYTGETWINFLARCKHTVGTIPFAEYVNVEKHVKKALEPK